MWRCQTKPLDRQRFSVEIDGRLVTVWNFEESSPRPYFYPIRGPLGGELTRMGHPGAYDHDHHRSDWFAHNKVMGVDFWADESLTIKRLRLTSPHATNA